MKVRLPDDVKAEPRYRGWRAWTNLVPPLTAALTLTKRQLARVRERQPDLFESAFVSVAAERALADAYCAARRLLPEPGCGCETLDRIHAALPDALQGCIEPVFRSDGSPDLRIIEAALYRRHFDRTAQAIRLKTLGGDAELTPLPHYAPTDHSSVDVAVAFDSDAVDLIGRSRSRFVPLSDLLDALAASDAQAARRLAVLFTDSPFPVLPPVEAGRLRLTTVGHAAVLIESAGTTILTDPVIPYGNDGDRLSFSRLPQRIDVVLLSHGHLDHLDIESLLQLRDRIGVVVVPRAGGESIIDPSLSHLLGAIGFRSVREMSEFEVMDIDGGRITALPFLGEHGGLDIRAKACFHVELCRRSLLFAADSCYRTPALYADYFREAAPIDVLFVCLECVGSPLSLIYTALLPVEITAAQADARRSRASNAAEALSLAQLTRTRRVCIYAMGDEPWMRVLLGPNDGRRVAVEAEVDRLKAACAGIGVPLVRPMGYKEFPL